MAQLAIKGHATRGEEVVGILSMLGGIQCGYGCNCKGFYFIDDCKNIVAYDNIPIHRKNDFIIFSIEEFLEKYPYKIGDKVNYVKYNDECPNVYTIQGMRWNGVSVEYLLNLNGFSALAKDLRHYKEETMEEQKKDYDEWFPTDYLEFENNDDTWADEVEINLGKDYEIQFRGDKTFIVKKKLQYPKSYKECCKVMGIDPNNYLSIRKLHSDDGEEETTNYEQDFLDIFDSLWKVKICRDVYWKIAGEQMGLGKPWEPDWKDESENKYTIVLHGNKNCYANCKGACSFLTFPTEEMRDSFYENFKDLIDGSKEFL